MNNYIVVNDQHIELTEDQVAQIIAAYAYQSNSVRLSEVAVGDAFKIGEHDFIALEQSGDTVSVICKDLLPDKKFGNANNFHGSDVGETCYKFAAEIAAIIGAENIVPHTVDLTSNDGLKCYGTIESRCSLLTADLYRRFVDILDRFKPDDWWWLATPWSTEKHGSDSFVLCVSPSGCIDYYRYGDVFGVRPFCILKSNIFVSK